MSGIAAIIHFDGRPVAPGDIVAMTNAMAHRGPDGITHHEIGSVALGHCMLRTTTESLEEVQPVVNVRRDVWLVVDGWLDNWEELRAEVLRNGGALRNRSDAELILAAYELWGEDCVLHMGGDFAFVIWDAKRQAAFCARDRVGNKPLVYYRTATSLVVASEPSAILALRWIPREVNEGLLVERLAGEWLSRDETLWMNVFRLVAAHRLSITRGRATLNRYWEPDLHAPILYKRDEDYIAHYRDLFLDCVRRASRSHQPVAYEVSGGLDSSAIFCVAKHMHDAGRIAAPRIKGYTLDFSADSDANEMPFARSVGAFLGMQIAEIAPTIESMSWYLAQAKVACEHAPLPNSAMMLGLRHLAHAEGSRVIINGCGGDEWLQGSRAYYAEELVAGRFANLMACAVSDLRSVGIRTTVHAMLRDGLFEMLPLNMRRALRAAVRRSLGRFKPDYWLSQGARDDLIKRRHSFASRGPKARTAGQRALLNTLYEPFRDWSREAEERLTAGRGLEARRPLDTPALLQFALSTPERLRLRGDTTKYVHVMALKGLVPREVLDRKTKAEFSIVMRDPLDRLGHWFERAAGATSSRLLAQQGVSELFRFYGANPQVGWPMSVLWTIYGSQNIQ